MYPRGVGVGARTRRRKVRGRQYIQGRFLCCDPTVKGEGGFIMDSKLRTLNRKCLGSESPVPSMESRPQLPSGPPLYREHGIDFLPSIDPVLRLHWGPKQPDVYVNHRDWSVKGGGRGGSSPQWKSSSNGMEDHVEAPRPLIHRPVILAERARSQGTLI